MILRVVIVLLVINFSYKTIKASPCGQYYLPKPYVGFLVKLRDAGYTNDDISHILGIKPLDWFGPALDQNFTIQLKMITQEVRNWRNSEVTYFTNQYHLDKKELESANAPQQEINFLKGDALRDYDDATEELEDIFKDLLFSYKEQYSGINTISLQKMSSKDRIMGEVFYIVRNRNEKNRTIDLIFANNKINIRNIQLSTFDRAQIIKLNYKPKEIRLYPELVDEEKWMNTAYDLWRVEVKIYNDYD